MCAYPFHKMEEPKRSSPIPILIVVCILIGGGVYFVKNFKIEGLDGLAIQSHSEDEASSEIDPLDDLMFVSSTPGSGC